MDIFKIHRGRDSQCLMQQKDCSNGTRNNDPQHLKHGIDFKEAVRIFDGRPVVLAPSKYPDEERWIATGKLSGQMFSVVYTFRDNRIRIITARRE